jgi:hypothetical protein
LNGSEPPGIVWVEPTGRLPARSDNMLAVEPPKLVRLDRNDSTEDLDITLVAMQPGTYQVAFEIGYAVGGIDRTQRTDSIRIYRK